METVDIKNLNEFTDWTSGENSITEQVLAGIDEDHKISGKSIRELIQGKLQVPFVTNDDDPEKDKIYFFSSEYAKNLWKTYTDNESPLYDEEKAASLVLYSMDLPATYSITGLEDFLRPRYIIEGNSGSENAVLNYTLGLTDALGNPDSDVIKITYTITDSSENITYNESYSFSTGDRVTKNIYQYLKSGENKVTIKASANNHRALTSRTFSIYLVRFNISSNFSGYYTGVSNGLPFTFDITIDRSITNLPITTNVFIDNVTNENNPAYTWTYTDSGANPSRRVEISNSYLPSDYEHRRTHTLVIRSSMEDPETSTKFNSNILVYQFEVSSSLGDLANAFVNYSYSVPNSLYQPVNETGKVVLQATQYVPFTLNWGYYTDNGLLQANVTWFLRKGENESEEYLELASVLGIKGIRPTNITFIASEALSFEDDHSYLVAKIGDDIIEEFPINVAENNIDVTEKENYSLKLSAYGKTNSSISKNQWVDHANNVSTTFTGVSFDNTNGWDNNSLVLKGAGAYATINYCPFPSTYNDSPYNVSNEGATFEIDFKPEYVANNNDILMSIGNINGAHIEITPNSAAYYESGSAVVKTNFKSGERIKLCFIFNRYSEVSNSSNLVYIVNNGILERAANRGAASITDDSGNIKIGGTNSSIRVYMIRAYRQDLSPKEALDNYMFDNISNADLISRNDVYKNSASVTYAGVQGKQDIILIEGDLTNILRNASEKKNATVQITRESNLHADKDFTVTNCRIRNHGQSTLSYPITSMKIWLNKSNKYVEQVGQGGATTLTEITPTFTCASQSYLGLNKNRYIMKDGAIPSNKFVLQANYADSSGAHNGSLLRLIQDTWYNAKFGENNEFKLRTAPQLFTSGMRITHNNPNLGEDGSWVEGVCNVPGSTYAGRTWTEIAHTPFPYAIRVAADSFPCTVFYRDTSTDDRTLKLLGQYVFMDDKKSDFVYGERSIYYTDDITDPFCLKVENSKKDKNANKVWDNDNVLQVEVVYPNSPLTSYSSKTIAESYTVDEETMTLTPTGTQHRFDDPVEYDDQNRPTSFLWEQHFELIYPDKEDITDSNKNFDPTKFAQTVQPFTQFLEWITDVSALRNTGAKLGETGSQARVTQAELNKFISEAHDHLDLYKLAAYYIFFLRFGLVDSVERNALLKTYDGQHWHYEPWDMDIALGCANNGVIAYDPPIDRNTRGGGNTYAFSGRTAQQSNALWDCLECWDYWANTIVPETAQALYEAGLTYYNAAQMFDKEYVERWSETLYNESGQYKYIDATSDGTYRRYLNGARTSHRHWWLSTSMNYYDAKWSCGDFTNHAIEFRISKSADVTGSNIIKIYPTNNTFFKAQYGSKGDQIITTLGNGLTEATVVPGGEALIDANVQLDDKQPCFIFGANSIEQLDLSNLLVSTTNNLGRGYMDIKLNGAYDNVLGARLKSLKLGAPTTPNIYTTPNATQYTSNLTVGQNAIITLTEDGHDALENLEHLDVNGWYCKQQNPNNQWLSDMMSGRKNIKTLYALGCNTATEFQTSSEGNNFEDLRLPTSIQTLRFSNSSWENISFWETTDLTSTSAQYDKVDIPATVTTLVFDGTTAKNECSLQLVLDWITSIENTLPVNHTEDDLLAELANYTLQAELIEWGTGDIKLYYNDLIRLAQFNKGGKQHNLSGYVIISDQDRLTAVQIANLISLYGENTFNVGTINTNLVVDQNQGFVRISTNATIDPILNKLTVSEPHTIRATATRFTLTTTQYTNYIIGVDQPLSYLEQNTPEGVYFWGLSETAGDTLNIGGSYKSASLRKLATGNIVVDMNEGDFGNYSLYLNVFYYDSDTSSVKSDSVELYVIGVTYPSDIQFSYSGNPVRKFNYTRDIAADIFGQVFSQLVVLPDIYVMSNRNLKTEFYINLGTGFTATPNSIQFYLTSIDDSQWNSGQLNSTDLTGGSNEVISIEPVLQNQIGYSRDAVSGGININVIGDAPSTIKKYRLYATILIGGRTSLTKDIVILTYDDSSVVVAKDNSKSLYRVLKALYNAEYDNSWDKAFYKTDLLSLYGTLDFSSDVTATLLDSNNSRSVLLYTPYISSIILDGCSSLPYSTLGGNVVHLNLANIKNLTSLSLVGCIEMNNSTIDLTGHTETTSLDVRDTQINVVIPLNSTITSLKLGSPFSVSIDRPTSLGSSGTTLSIQSSTNLQTVTLLHINNSIPKSYSVFDIITA